MKTEKFHNRSTWAAGPWDKEPDRVEWKDAATGLNCLAKRTESGIWCGYVGVPPSNPNYGRDYNEVEADVHGGLTYGDHCQDGPGPMFERICHTPQEGEPDHLFWFGFDCHHGGDLSPARDSMFLMEYAVYRDLDYVKSNIEELAKNLASV